MRSILPRSASRPPLVGALALATAIALGPGCIGTTGSELVTFRAFGAGPADAPPGGEGLSFVNGRGWSITLTRATVHLGALYLNRSAPVSGGQERACFLPGVYVAQVTSGVDVDALSPELQPFPEAGTGTADPAITGEVWLAGGRIDDLDDRTVVGDVAGTAIRGAESMRFEGTVTINNRRIGEPTDPARPGRHPLCAERIVSPIPVAITPTDGGSLVVRVDPRAWFANVELAELEPASEGSDLHRIPDDGSTQPSINLYRGLRRAAGVYHFEWFP